MQGETVQYID